MPLNDIYRGSFVQHNVNVVADRFYQAVVHNNFHIPRPELGTISTFAVLDSVDDVEPVRTASPASLLSLLHLKQWRHNFGWQLTKQLLHTNIEGFPATSGMYVTQAKAKYALLRALILDPKHETIVSSTVVNIRMEGAALNSFGSEPHSLTKMQSNATGTFRFVKYSVHIDDELIVPETRTQILMDGSVRVVSWIAVLALYIYSSLQWTSPRTNCRLRFRSTWRLT
jgi:hypothetical protein